MAFHVGQRVVCVSPPKEPIDYPGFTPSVVGRVYTIREIYISPHTGGRGLRFAEVVNPINKFWRVEFGYNANRFRPVVERKTDISIFKAMLTPNRVSA